MAKKHQQELLDTAKEAADNLFGYTEVSKQQTLDAMEDLRSHIDTMIEAVKSDIENEEDDEHS